MSTLGTEKAAELLFWSRQTGVPLQSFPPDVAPQNLEQAYEIQSAVAQLRRMMTVAFKVGLTSVEAQRAAHVSDPIVGRLAAPDILKSPAKISVREADLRIVEAEVVFELAGDLVAHDAPFTLTQIAASVRAAFAAIEVCNSRFSNVDDVSLAEIVADNSNAELLVIGEPLTGCDFNALDQLPVTLTRQGQPAVQGSTANVLGHPLKSLTWFANWMAARGESLRRGQLIASGSCTGMTQTAPNDFVVVTFGAQARASIELASVSIQSGITL